MKKQFSAAFLLILVFSLSAWAGTRIDAKAWKNVQTYDVRTLAPSMAPHTRQLVAVKFTFRGKDIHHLKPNGKKGFSDVRVMVAKKDLDAFKSITTDASSSTELTVYGRVLRDFDSNFFFVQLIGSNLVTDPKGNATISW